MRDVDGPGRDGSLDNMIVAHEWGHYFHHRLSDCNTAQCGAMSEGWGDFMALHTALREGDNLDGTFGAGIYGPTALGDSGYFGIRRFPYSVDFSKNGLTFKHIQNGVAAARRAPATAAAPTREVHNAGEVWCSMLLEAYVGLHKAAGRPPVRGRPPGLRRLHRAGAAAGPAQRHLHRDPRRHLDRHRQQRARRPAAGGGGLRPPGRRQLRRLAAPRARPATWGR